MFKPWLAIRFAFSAADSASPFVASEARMTDHAFTPSGQLSKRA